MPGSPTPLAFVDFDSDGTLELVVAAGTSLHVVHVGG
jgi:hypothetical protein